ncbi:hypothetical protein GOBAR_DD29933 [Gossypium barbadense]|nr:hypothetical protein GOBAR_DD29933 [Gossypium barbadense]
MKHSLIFGDFWAFFILLSGSLVASYGSLSLSTFDGPLYDFTAYTECKAQPEEPLYQEGILKDEPPIMRPAIFGETATGFYTPAWIKIQSANSALIRASLKTENRTYNCVGTVLAKNAIYRSRMKNWFVERFSAAVFENGLKWYATEPDQGKTNYTLADQMLEFVRAHQIIARAHNIFWEDPKYTPS